MRTRRGNTVLALLLTIFSLSGCGTEPHLSSDELAQKYPEKKYIQIDGVSLHYDQQGLGPPLILLHGFPTSSCITERYTAAKMPLSYLQTCLA